MYSNNSQVPLQHPVPQHAFKPPLTPDSLAKSTRNSIDSNQEYQRTAIESDPYNPASYAQNQYAQNQYSQNQFNYYSPQVNNAVPSTSNFYQQPVNSWNLNDGTTQMGIQFGKSAFAAGHDYVDKNFTKHLPLPIVKSLFNVNTKYVGHKIRIILFPWKHKPWMRLRNESIGPDGVSVNVGYLSPREDVNSPDLYIPCKLILK